MRPSLAFVTCLALLLVPDVDVRGQKARGARAGQENKQDKQDKRDKQDKQESAPKVAKLEPTHLSTEVDARKVDELVVTFDQDMTRDSHSWVGGGPRFPKCKRVRWKDKRTCIMVVELEPGHDYQLSLNSSAANNFRSAEGLPLAPTAWRFSTLPEARKLRPIRKQRALNRKAWQELWKVLEGRYSYFDEKKLDWHAIRKERQDEVLACRTDKGWVSAVGKMLTATNDIHLSVRLGDYVVGGGSRAVDPLFRQQRIPMYLESVSQATPGVLVGATKDGIGYMMISSWTKQVDFDKVEELLAKYVGEDSKLKAMVLDVRSNSGGGEDLAMRVAKYFVAPGKAYAKNCYRVRPGKDGFGPVLTRRMPARSDVERFQGPVAVLMSRYCMSSCEAFLLMMRQADDVTLVGQRSYGSSGNPKSHDLPNGAAIVLPSWKALRLDGTCFEDEGLKPDIEVVPTADELEKKDLILEKALEQLRNKV